ncbi:MAG: tobe domain protein [Bacteroidales bacterium]|nr:tobe domain protein [Bacteroidales bacterium]
MNKLEAKITQIQQSGAILLVDAEVDGQVFSALLIESATNPEWLQIGHSVNLVFKETEVSLAKNLAGTISIRNKMVCTVISINKGELLSKIEMKFNNYTIGSLITTRAVNALELIVNEEIIAMVKSNEISLMC